MENSVLGFRGHAKKCICVNAAEVSSAFQQQTVLEMSSLRGVHARANYSHRNEEWKDDTNGQKKNHRVLELKE